MTAGRGRRRSVFPDASFRRVSFRDVSLRGAVFRGVVFHGVPFHGVPFRGVPVHGVRDVIRATGASGGFMCCQCHAVRVNEMGVVTIRPGRRPLAKRYMASRTAYV
ncbi:pentapeptide repeat-containing protein [Streptomyces sp. NPDC002164]|uniref:pentapeptide repeat-containing protein n=1 Tax=unclassified Streptomyces TaxID=2593676 RepID=UPI0036C37DEA